MLATHSSTRNTGLVAQSPAMRAVLATMEKAAGTDASVHVHGENGTGKELIARAIHYGGGRRARPLVTLDAAAIPTGLAESQLFGHARGAFTGAVESREGVFARAHTGTLFIDEIGELGLTLQSKLLRVLQFSEFTQVGSGRGSGRGRRVDVRVITATNRDLRRAMEGGTFRRDLYHRIGVIHIVIPPLRERRDDIPLLAHHFVERFARAYGRATRRLSSRTLDLFAHHDWPGNVRELENCIEQAVIFGGGDVLEVHDVRNALAHRPASEAHRTPAPGEAFRGRTLQELEQWYITATLARCGGNRTRTARSLGLSLRGLQYKLKAYERHLTTAIDPSRPGVARPEGHHASRAAMDVVNISPARGLA